MALMREQQHDGLTLNGCLLPLGSRGSELQRFSVDPDHSASSACTSSCGAAAGLAACTAADESLRSASATFVVGGITAATGGLSGRGFQMGGLFERCGPDALSDHAFSSSSSLSLSESFGRLMRGQPLGVRGTAFALPLLARFEGAGEESSSLLL